MGRNKSVGQLTVDLDVCIAAKSDCAICIDHCPNSALFVESGRVTLKPNLCEKCGACIRWCPLGAISFDFFSTQKAMERLGQIADQHQVSDAPLPASVILTCQKSAAKLSIIMEKTQKTSRSYLLQVPCIGAVSPLVLMEGLRRGFGAVICACVEPQCANHESAKSCDKLIASLKRLAPPSGEKKEAGQLCLAVDEKGLQTILDGTENKITEADRIPPAPGMPPACATYRDALIAQVRPTVKKTPDQGRLKGLCLPFYDLRIDAAKCSLCGACKRNCPTGALTLVDANTRKLMFATNACIGCKTCVNRCPEEAVSLEAVFLPHAVTNATIHTKVEAKTIRCQNCGRPVSNQFLLEKVEKQMHAQGFGAASTSVYLCKTCKRMQALFS